MGFLLAIHTSLLYRFLDKHSIIDVCEKVNTNFQILSVPVKIFLPVETAEKANSAPLAVLNLSLVVLG